MTTKETNIITAVILMIAGLPVPIVGTCLLRGWALSVLWGWFAVPIFHLPGLSIAQSIAVSMLLSLMTHPYVPSKDGDKFGPLAFSLLTPLVAVGMGWVIKGFV